MAADDIKRRLDKFHRPYHQAVEQTLLTIRDRFGTAILVDVHSMPPLTATATQAPRIVMGDYILRRHGEAQGSIHSIQIEVDRSLYLDSMQREPGPGLESTASLISELLFCLVDLVSERAIPLAAE